MARIEPPLGGTDYSIHPASHRVPLLSEQPNLSNDKGVNVNSNQPWADFQFKTKDMEALYATGKGSHKYPEAVVKGFFKAMQKIAAARHEQDLYNLRSLKFHQLSGNRESEYAVWLTGNWRLILKIEEEAESKYLSILRIEDYH
jgi:plasmid maintenance system killer protein